MERLVVTDREAIETLVEDAADAVERGDWTAAASAFDEDFRYESARQDKPAFLAWARRTWEALGDSELSASAVEVSVSGERAAVRVRITTSILRGRPVTARIECVKRPEGWRIARLVEHDGGGFVR